MTLLYVAIFSAGAGFAIAKAHNSHSFGSQKCDDIKEIAVHYKKPRTVLALGLIIFIATLIYHGSYTPGP